MHKVVPTAAGPISDRIPASSRPCVSRVTHFWTDTKNPTLHRQLTFLCSHHKNDSLDLSIDKLTSTSNYVHQSNAQNGETGFTTHHQRTQVIMDDILPSRLKYSHAARWLCRGEQRIVGLITRGQVLDWCPPAVLFYPIRKSICCPTQLLSGHTSHPHSRSSIFFSMHEAEVIDRTAMCLSHLIDTLGVDMMSFFLFPHQLSSAPWRHAVSQTIS
ncbi:uncharacterized protein LOC117826235 [Notolabrus celidotus]|uniref:uncharacterized protein LOC117826235 n=1 Tax=Notolabrus celidotus TaxID=1203425 RepID=UPI00149007A9|nr:uncharacterized protein LOC117826235 [Notolabrus celidotus]